MVTSPPVSITLCAALLFFSSELFGEERLATIAALPAARGVATEARTIIDAPAEKVARLAADPAAFLELLPAAVVRQRPSVGEALVVEVERREPWPIGAIRWIESVRLHQTPDGTFVVERQALDRGYFQNLQATWWVTPLGENRCAVTYRVAMELRRWAPLWILRRGNNAGMLGTLSRLRRMSERPLGRLDASRTAP